MIVKVMALSVSLFACQPALWPAGSFQNLQNARIQSWTLRTAKHILRAVTEAEGSVCDLEVSVSQDASMSPGCCCRNHLKM